MNEVIGNEIILSDYLTYDDFLSHEELELFSSFMFEANPRKIESFGDIFDGVFGDRLTKPIWQNTKHENIFKELFPFLKCQVVFGLGKGAYKKYGVLKYTADFYSEEENKVYEIDGNSHKTELQKLKDEKRDLILELEFGIKTVRFTNKQVEEMLLERIRANKVVERIAEQSINRS
ncbi:endonuclease domain-containing protein [Staphylococcus agnetis]|uniref:endonuclease domain-containing protein n=1 Tax=Staphylococcus agnetis TaxID=985762 RepID=UPI00208F4A41|nr:DUF559 domain-containing protein [Staphylococcus agnetis]MCO4347473.1 endonuclease domain-containing protein [Staphylococcus agnetis]